MDVLPRKPMLWQYTSGKTGEYNFRWVPVTARQLQEVEQLIFAFLFFSSCRGRKDIGFRRGDRVLYGMAPPPYTTGTMTRVFPNELFKFLPPIAEAEKLTFEDRTKKGLEMAFSEGMDLCFAMSSVALAISDRFSRPGRSSGRTKALLKNPRIAVRFLKGIIKAKIAGRKLMPKDLWNLKGLVTFGMDSAVFRDKLAESWGQKPFEFHGCTESIMVAMQTWDKTSMTFIPQLNFFEFIPEDEAVKSWQDPTYQPKTYLIDEVKPGNYELVITSFHGGPFIRYRLGHLIKITSLNNSKLGIDIPQMEFLTRIDDQIDIAGFTRLSEKAIWQAIEKTGIEYEGWTARKEVIKNKPTLSIYLEPSHNSLSPTEVANTIHEELVKLDKGYADLNLFTGLRAVEVNLLKEGTFKLYKLTQKARGAELAHLRPPHINPSDQIIKRLTQSGIEASIVESQKVMV
jgi:hypothetical protein